MYALAQSALEIGNVTGSLRMALRWASHHTGLPVLLVAAMALVLSWKLLRRMAGFAVEVVVAVALLAVATRLGWIAW